MSVEVQTVNRSRDQDATESRASRGSTTALQRNCFRVASRRGEAEFPTNGLTPQPRPSASPSRTSRRPHCSARTSRSTRLDIACQKFNTCMKARPTRSSDAKRTTQRQSHPFEICMSTTHEPGLRRTHTVCEEQDVQSETVS